MSNFQKYTGTYVRTFPGIDLTAVPGLVYDFGVLSVPAGYFQSDAGPATGVFDNAIVVGPTPSLGTVGYTGPTLPSYTTGTEYVWIKTDGAGVLLDIVAGVA